jgi:Pyruvate/2-oxoacid:ferredoxin oxidoreductase gamma subunit
MIGALARVLDMPPLAMIAAAIREDIAIKPEQNIQAAHDAYAQVQLFGLVDQGNNEFKNRPIATISGN